MKVNNKILRWIFICLIAVSFGINYSAIFDYKMDMNGDNFCYFMLAKNLAEGKGYVSDFGPTVTPHLHFPPGYPLFLSVIYKVFNGSTEAMKISSGLLFLLSLLLMFRIIRKTVPKGGLYLAFASTLICTFHPVLLRWSTMIMSEMLYMAVSFGMIAIFIDLDLEKLAQKDNKQIALVILLCVLVFYTYLIRSMGLAIIISLAAAIAIKGITILIQKKKGWLLPICVSAAVIFSALSSYGALKLHNEIVAPGRSESRVAFFTNKSASNKKMETLDDWGKRISTNMKSFVSIYIPKSLFSPKEANDFFYSDYKAKFIDWTLGAVVIILAVLGFINMAKGSLLLLLYTIITFAVLMLYQEQYAGLRYFVPLIPLLIFGVLSGLTFLCYKFVPKHKDVVSISVLALALICAGPFYIKEQSDFRKLASFRTDLSYPAENPYKQYIQASKSMSNAPYDLLVACRKPEIFYFNSMYHHAIGIPHSGSPEEVIKYFEKNKVNVVILDHLYLHAYKIVLPAVQAYPERFTLIQMLGDYYQPTYVFAFNPGR